MKPESSCPVFETFLAETLDDPAGRTQLQQYLGSRLMPGQDDCNG